MGPRQAREGLGAGDFRRRGRAVRKKDSLTAGASDGFRARRSATLLDMDTEFLPALLAIRAGKPKALRQLLEADPTLATRRSSCSHPTLLQALVLDGKDHAAALQIDMARPLLQRGAPLDEPLIAAASVDNAVLAELLLDEGASLHGSAAILDGWTPLEESLYWGSARVRDLLLARGAEPHNLRTAAGLGAIPLLRETLSREPADWGGVQSPFGAADVDGDLRQNLLDNALSYAALEDQREAACVLLDAGARANALPHGFDYRGSALHWAAIRGHEGLCRLLLDAGADPALRDLKIDKTAAEWAEHAGHHALAETLRRDEPTAK